MIIEYNNLYTHFIFNTLHRLPLISEANRPCIEKYITGIVNKHDCKMYAIYANAEHAHILVSRSPKISDESLATVLHLQMNPGTKYNIPKTYLQSLNGLQVISSGPGILKAYLSTLQDAEPLLTSGINIPANASETVIRLPIWATIQTAIILSLKT